MNGVPAASHQSLRMAFSRESVLLWSYTTFARNRIKFAALRDDPTFAHLHWTEITRPSHTRTVIDRLARAGGRAQRDACLRQSNVP
ncbi:MULTISPECIES: hypothetical protein [Burkholderia]|uniref:hypothetical protein n=1 Tax=Burkholderia TaxID=32008 RepID=UPI000B220B4B|nr:MULTISPECIES: hypothetical protein [Burkholderia]MCA8152826.1 hypothetical protein [Burkholderia contaminans]